MLQALRRRLASSAAACRMEPVGREARRRTAEAVRHVLRRVDLTFLDQPDQIAQGVTLHECHTARGQHRLDQLLDSLLCVESRRSRRRYRCPGETFLTSVSSSIALASSTRARSSRSCRGMQHSTLGERGVHLLCTWPVQVRRLTRPGP